MSSGEFGKESIYMFTFNNGEDPKMSLAEREKVL